MRTAIALAILAHFVTASPVVLGEASADIYPPASTSVDRKLFPPESVVGYAGPTPTGAHPFAFQTAPARQFPKFQDPFAPVFLPQAKHSSHDFSPIEFWGSLGPRFSLPGDTFGACGATPVIPDQCEVTQVHLLFRHGSRHPSSSEAVATFPKKINGAAKNGTFKGTGELEFMNDWTYKLGGEILNPFGRQQCYQLGVRSRMAYGHLLKNFTDSGTLPVWRSGSQDRMVETMETFAQGFFGRKSEEQYSLLLEIEGKGFNNTEGPYGSCQQAQQDYSGGLAARDLWTDVAFAKTAKRLQPYIKGGYQLTPADANAMVTICAYETLSLGYSKFCPLFTEEDFRNFEYAFDVEFYYGWGPGAQSGAALGKGYVEEFVARLTQTPITVWDSSTNSTLDGNPKTSPLNQSIYADGTHDSFFVTVLTALNLSAINTYGALPLHKRPDERTFRTSHLVPFNTNLEVQVMSCKNKPEPQLRFILNDAILPLHKTYPGCRQDKNGLCAVPTVVKGLTARLAQIDHHKVCSTNWTAPAPEDLKDVNGLPHFF